jgi:hypothetical protein
MKHIRPQTKILLAILIIVSGLALYAQNELSSIQIANKEHNTTTGSEQVVIVGRGVTTPQTNNFGSTVIVDNLEHNAALGAKQVFVNESSAQDFLGDALNALATPTPNTVAYVDNAGDWTYLPLGAATEVLTSNGATSAPSWEAGGGGNDFAEYVNITGVGPPYLSLKNTTAEDIDEGRESLIYWEGVQSGGEVSRLAEIEGTHDGASDDEKGQILFNVNDGDDGASPTLAATLTSTAFDVHSDTDIVAQIGRQKIGHSGLSDYAFFGHVDMATWSEMALLQDNVGNTILNSADSVSLRISNSTKLLVSSAGLIGIGTSSQDRKLEVLDASNPQLRLTHTNDTVYAEFQADSNGDLIITPSGDEVTVNGGVLYEDGTYGEIYVHDGSTGQTIATGASYVKLTAFTTDGLSSNVTNAAASDVITFTKIGIYRVNVTVGASSDTVATADYSLFLNGGEQEQCEITRKYANTLDVGASSFSCLIDVTTASWDIDLRVRHDNGGNVDITISDANMNVQYVGET